MEVGFFVDRMDGLGRLSSAAITATVTRDHRDGGAVEPRPGAGIGPPLWPSLL